MSEPITRHSQGDRGYKLCKCSKCNIVKTCTPMFDFYTTNQLEDPDLLICECCMRVDWSKSKVVINNLIKQCSEQNQNHTC